MEVVPAPNSTVPRLSLKRSLLKPRTDVPTDKTDVDYNTLLYEMNDRVGVYHLILDSTLTPNLDNANMPPPRYTQVAWSPPGLLHYGRCLLATLTNYGSAKVEYSCNRHWRLVIDVSESWTAVCRLGWESRALSQQEQYEELCRREAQLRIVAIAWSGLRGKPNSESCLLAAAHRDGVVSLWQVPVVRFSPLALGEADAVADEEAMSTVTAGLAFTLETGTACAPGRPLIGELHWLSLQSDHLLVGDSSGRVRMWDTAPLALGRGQVPDAIDVYPTADRIKVTKMTDCKLPDGREERLVVVIKGSYLVVTLIDAEGRTLGTAVKDFKHVALTGVVVTKPGCMVVSAREGAFYLVECSVVDAGLRTVVTPLRSYLSFAHNSCYGMAASQHRMIWVIASSVSKMYDHLVVKQPTQFHFVTITNPAEAVPMLVENSSMRLTRHLDCLEILRIQCQKLCQRPPVDVTIEDLDPLTNYQLRLSLWLTSVALTINADMEAEDTRQLKDLNNRIRQLLFARHACERVEMMLASVVSRGATEEELNCINLLRTWMLTFTETPVAAQHWRGTCARVAAILTGSQGLEELIKEYCHICESEVENTWIQGDQWMFATCLRGHSVPRCSLSLLPCVTLPYYTCPTCRIPAHPAFVTDKEPLCVFCDGILRPDESVSMEPPRA